MAKQRQRSARTAADRPRTSRAWQPVSPAGRALAAGGSWEPLTGGGTAFVQAAVTGHPGQSRLSKQARRRRLKRVLGTKRRGEKLTQK